MNQSEWINYCFPNFSKIVPGLYLRMAAVVNKANWIIGVKICFQRPAGVDHLLSSPLIIINLSRVNIQIIWGGFSKRSIIWVWSKQCFPYVAIIWELWICFLHVWRKRKKRIFNRILNRFFSIVWSDPASVFFILFFYPSSLLWLTSLLHTCIKSGWGQTGNWI